MENETDVKPQEGQPASAPSAEADQNPVPERDYKGEYENVQKALEKEREESRRYRNLYQAAQKPEPTRVQPDENGTIDPVAYAESIKADLRQEMRYQKAVDDDWTAALREYPQLASNAALSRAVRGMQREELLEGRLLTASDAARELMKELAGAKEEGTREAQVSERVQERAGIPQPSGQGGPGPSLADRYRKGKLSAEEARDNWERLRQELSQPRN